MRKADKMKILYLGTICDLSRYQEMLKRCKVKPSVAATVFESALLKGFSENNADIEILSYPAIPAFPKSPFIYFGGYSEVLMQRYNCYWLKSFNLPFFKQLIRRFDARKKMIQWAKKNENGGVILTYSIPPFLAKSVIGIAKKYNLKTVAIIPDLPKNMYMNHKISKLGDLVRQKYLKLALCQQGAFDAYIYLTESMHDIIAPQKPYIVMEGIFDDTTLCKIAQSESVCKASPRAIMYAGRLHQKYGINNLMDAYEMLGSSDTELWLFGDGTAIDDVKNRVANNPRVRYFGNVSRESILKFEQQATVLVNPRSTKDDFTKYSFPSKTIEYMASGTPLLTTRLDGIPNDYYQYVFSISDNDKALLSNALRQILSLSDEELSLKGNIAKRFVYETKNAKVQTLRIMDFLKKISGDNS